MTDIPDSDGGEPDPPDPRRTRRYIVAGVVIVGAVAAYAVHLSRSGRSGDGPSLEEVGAVALAHLIEVRGHTKMQAHGPGFSQHRQIHIDPYVRRAA
jgi:hypothetical protein